MDAATGCTAVRVSAMDPPDKPGPPGSEPPPPDESRPAPYGSGVPSEGETVPLPTGDTSPQEPAVPGVPPAEVPPADVPGDAPAPVPVPVQRPPYVPPYVPPPAAGVPPYGTTPVAGAGGVIPPNEVVVAESGRPWWHWAALAGLLLTLAIVILAIFLATRPPKSAQPQALATASASASASPSASPTPIPFTTPTPTAAPTPTPTPPPTATPVPAPKDPVTAATLLFPTGGGTECGASDPTYRGCPVTSTLVGAANKWRSNNPGNPMPLCRCASGYVGASPVRDDSKLPSDYPNNGRNAAVVVAISFGSSSESVVVLFKQQADGTWLGNDTYCKDSTNRLTSSSPQACG